MRIVLVPGLLLLTFALGGCGTLMGSGTVAVEGFEFLGRERFACGGESHVVELYLHRPTGLEFVLIPGGEFLMGCPEEYGEQRTVRVEPFLLARTAVTQAAWDRVGGEDVRHWRGAQLPIEGVSWEDALAWCERVGLRLPSEAEWEFACRAGTTSRFHFGDAEGELDRYAWFDANSGWRTQPAARKLPNAFGLFDMHGNVLEWCQDAWEQDGEGPTGFDRSRRGGVGPDRVIRGGCWCYRPHACRSAFRHWAAPDFRGRILGVRPAASVRSVAELPLQAVGHGQAGRDQDEGLEVEQGRSEQQGVVGDR